MTLKIAILEIDGDGMIADTSRRELKATQIAPHEGLLPALVKFDQLREGAFEAVQALLDRGFMLFYLTARPLFLQHATEEWLARHELRFELRMQDPRAINSSAWWQRQVRDIVEDIGSTMNDPMQVLFVHPEQLARRKVAELEDSRIMVKASLADALMTDQARHSDLSASSPLLAFCQEATAIAERREAFEQADHFELRIQHPQDERGSRGAPLYIEAWTCGEERRVGVTEKWEPDGEPGGRPVLQFLMSGEGEVCEVLISDAMTGGELFAAFSEFEAPGKIEAAQQGYAAWKAEFLREAGYLEAARLARNSVLYGEAWAMEQYQAARHEAAQRWVERRAEHASAEA